MIKVERLGGESGETIAVDHVLMVGGDGEGAEPRPGTPEEFAKLQRDEYAELAKLIKETGMKVQ